jgi:hypothetical protein
MSMLFTLLSPVSPFLVSVTIYVSIRMIGALPQGHNRKSISRRQWWPWTRRFHHLRRSDEAPRRRWHAATSDQLSEISSWLQIKGRKESAPPLSCVKFCTLHLKTCYCSSLPLHCATATTVQMEAPVPEIMDTTSCYFHRHDINEPKCWCTPIKVLVFTQNNTVWTFVDLRTSKLVLIRSANSTAYFYLLGRDFVWSGRALLTLS